MLRSGSDISTESSVPSAWFRQRKRLMKWAGVWGCGGGEGGWGSEWAPFKGLGPERREVSRKWEGLRGQEVGTHCCLVRCSLTAPSWLSSYSHQVSDALGTDSGQGHSGQPWASSPGSTKEAHKGRPAWNWAQLGHCSTTCGHTLGWVARQASGGLTSRLRHSPRKSG